MFFTGVKLSVVLEFVGEKKEKIAGPFRTTVGQLVVGVHVCSVFSTLWYFFFILLSMTVIFVLEIFKCFMQNVSVSAMIHMVCLIGTPRVITLSTSKEDSVTVKKTLEDIRL
jgi:hypothetical protein